MRRCLLAVLLLAGTLPVAEARLYEWRNPHSGSVQLSGAPPGWYRSDAGGPRVRVYEEGRLVDDTAIELPAAHRARLREEAFRELERRQQAEAARRLELAARREARRRELAAKRREAAARAAAREARNDAETGHVAESSAPAPTQGELDAATVERLKAIISEWDSRNTAQ